MNILTVREAIKSFVSNYIPIYRWDMDVPDTLYWQRNGFNIYACSAIELPLQELSSTRNGYNNVLMSARFPYRVTWIFNHDQPIDNLPIKAVEGVVGNLQAIALVSSPSEAIQSFTPYVEPDPITIAQTEDESQDWLVSANFSFLASFQVTTLADTGDLTEPGFFDLPNPLPLTQVGLRTYKAKIGFDRTVPSDSKLDQTFTIN